jgi:hypothetical protein
MSRSSKRAACLVTGCAVLSLALSATPAMAQDSPTAASIKALQDKGKDGQDGGKAKPIVAKDASVSSSLPRAGKRPLLRCWQEGKLVYEGAGMQVAAQQGTASIDLRNGNALAVQIFDLKNGMCLLDHSPE